MDKIKTWTQSLWGKLALIFIILLGMVGLYGLVVSQSSKIYPGVRVETFGLGGLSKKEARKKLEDSLRDRLTKDLVLTYKEDQFTTNLEDLGYSYDLDGMVDEAYQRGHTGSFGQNFIAALGTFLEGPLPLEGGFDEETLNGYIQGLGDKLYQKSKDAKVNFDHGQVTISKDRPGRYLDLNETKSAILSWTGEGEIRLPVYTQDAQVQAQSLAKINGLLGEFSTTYGTSEKNRKFNIALGAEKLHGRLIQPGETVSFNDAMDQITTKAGFKTSGVIKNGEFDRGVGGGICQVSTTLYNALVMADLEIVERHNHSRPIGYVKNGTDAAVATGYKNLVFKNSFKSPIYILSSADGKTLDFKILGNLEEKDYEVAMVPKLQGRTSPKTITRYSDRLPQGQRQVQESGHSGSYYKTYIEKSRDGEVFERKQISTSSYIPGKRVVLIGTGTPSSSTSDKDTDED